jgi:tetratricopeptide (TPR) repeat protein
MNKFLLIFVLFFSNLTHINCQENTTLKNIDRTQRLVDSLNLISEKLMKSNPQESIEYIIKSFNLSKKINYKKGELIALNNLGRSYYDLGEYEKSLSNLYSALQLAEKLNNLSEVGKINNDIGMCHRSTGNFVEALENHENALEIFKSQNHKSGIGRSLNNIGICKFSMGDTDIESYFTQALKLYNEANDLEGIATSLNNLAIYYSSINNYTKAEEYFFSSINILDQIGNTTALQMCYNNLGKLNILKRDFQKAKKYLDTSMAMNEKIGAKENLFNNYILFQQLYEETDNYKQALYYSKELSKLKDTLFQDKRTEQINRLNTIYNLKNKEKELDFLQIELSLKNKLTYFLIAIIAGLLIIALLVFAIFKYRLKIAKDKQLLLKQEKKLTQLKINNQEKELEKLSQDNMSNQKRLENELEHINRELTTTAMKIMQNNEMLIELKDSLLSVDIKNRTFQKKIDTIINKINTIINNDTSWEQFVLHFNDVHPSFFKILKTQFPSITSKELKHCAFVKINLSVKEVAIMMNVTIGAVDKARSRIKTKFNLEKNTSLEDFIIQL